jgi:hypothetical protein
VAGGEADGPKEEDDVDLSVRPGYCSVYQAWLQSIISSDRKRLATTM